MTVGDYVESVHTGDRGRVIRVVNDYRIRVRFQFFTHWVARSDLRKLVLS